jgi:UDP-glucuronate 4-epimerase
MAVTPLALEGATVVVTGATGQVGLPVAIQLAQQGSDVWAPARFSDPKAKAVLEDAGVHCVTADLSTGEGLDGLPDQATAVANFAVAKTGKPDLDLAINAESVGILQQRFQDAQAFLHCSSTAVYAPSTEPVSETAALGDNGHRNMFPTYVFTKIAAEAVARTGAKLFDLPTTVARLNVPYGDNGGWPFFHLMMAQGGMDIDVHPMGSGFTPIHEDDIVRMLPYLLGAASVPATTVNLAGSEHVDIREWVAYLTEITGVQANIIESDASIEGVRCDTSALQEILGDEVISSVEWHEGIRRLVQSKAPDALVAS